MVGVAPVDARRPGVRQKGVANNLCRVHFKRFDVQEFVQGRHVQDQAPRAVRLWSKEDDIVQASVARRDTFDDGFVKQLLKEKKDRAMFFEFVLEKSKCSRAAIAEEEPCLLLALRQERESVSPTQPSTNLLRSADAAPRAPVEPEATADGRPLEALQRAPLKRVRVIRRSIRSRVSHLVNYRILCPPVFEGAGMLASRTNEECANENTNAAQRTSEGGDHLHGVVHTVGRNLIGRGCGGHRVPVRLGGHAATLKKF